MDVHMINFANAMRAAAAIALLMITPASAQGTKHMSTPILKRHTSAKTHHRLVLQVNSNDPAMMNLALNNAANVVQHYKESGEKVSIEVVTFGPGLHMLREDTSPVKARIETLALSTPEISFKACGNTKENMSKAENKNIVLIPQAQVVDSGVVRVMELQEHGWSYVKP
jgi:intracellular sulfur oxidation DsrE/DsrF family protein